MVRTTASNYVAAQPQIKKVTQILNQIAFRGNACFDAPPIPVWVTSVGFGLFAKILLNRRKPTSERTPICYAMGHSEHSVAR
jgi:hypothetical protein